MSLSQHCTLFVVLNITWRLSHLIPQVSAGKDLKVILPYDQIQANELKPEFAAQIAELRRQIENSNIQNPRIDNEFLAKMLRCRKYNLARAFKAIQSYYGGVSGIEQQINGLTPVDFKDIYDMNIVRVLKSKFQYTSVVVVQFRNWDLKKAPVQRLENAFTFLIEELLMDVETEVNGITGIVDLEGFSGSHAAAAVAEIRQIMKIVFQQFPIRLHGIHVVNAGVIFNTCYRVIKFILTATIKERLTFYGLQSDIVDVIGGDILPEFLGGGLEEHFAWSSVLEKIVQNNKPYCWYWNPEARNVGAN